MMADSSEKHAEKKPRHGERWNRLMHTARELFWKYGFKRVSIEEICEKSGVSKMTFYRHFANKTEIAKAVFDEEVQSGVVAFRNILNTPKFTTDQKMKMIISLKVTGSYDISKEFLQDFYSNPELGLKEHIEERTRAVWGEMLEDFRKAQRKGIFRKDFKPELFFHLSQKMADLINDKSMLGLYENPQALMVELTNMMLYGIVERGQEK
jgi:AcrR family transcriptional regulator